MALVVLNRNSMPKSTKPIAMFFIGDTHSGGDTALAHPDYQIKVNRPQALTPAQEWLYENFQDALRKVKSLVRGHHVVMGYLGDGGDGDHHDTTEAQGTPNRQAGQAVKLLRPWREIADEGRGLRGTPTHGGAEADLDEAICERLEIPCKWEWMSDVGGRRLWMGHEYITVGKKESSDDNAAIGLAKDIEFKCLRRGRKVPNLVVSGHVHRSIYSMSHDIHMVTTPCWQLSTSHGHSKFAFIAPDIGVVVWWPETMRVERILYPIPERLLGE